LLDYVQDKSAKEIRRDDHLKAAVDSYRRVVADLAGDCDAGAVFHQLFGILLARLFDGGRTGFASLLPLLESAGSS
jgi:hypothetical protein